MLESPWMPLDSPLVTGLDCMRIYTDTLTWKSKIDDNNLRIDFLHNVKCNYSLRVASECIRSATLSFMRAQTVPAAKFGVIIWNDGEGGANRPKPPTGAGVSRVRDSRCEARAHR